MGSECCETEHCVSQALARAGTRLRPSTRPHAPLSSALPWPTDTTFNVSNFDFTSDKTTCTSFDFTFDSTAKRTEPVPTNVASNLATADFAMDKVAPLDAG